MGAGISGLLDDEKLSSGRPSKTGLGDLPENCLALVLTHLDPVEISKMGRVNRTFHQASLTDLVWEQKLPQNYQILVRNYHLDDDESCTLTKKQMFARLCRPNHFGSSSNKVRAHHSSRPKKIILDMLFLLYIIVFFKFLQFFGLEKIYFTNQQCNHIRITILFRIEKDLNLDQYFKIYFLLSY